MASSQRKRECPYGEDEGARAAPHHRNHLTESKTTATFSEPPPTFENNPFFPLTTFVLPTSAYTSTSQRWQAQGHGEPKSSSSFPLEGMVQTSVESGWRGGGELASTIWGATSAWQTCLAPESSLGDYSACLEARLDSCLDISHISAISPLGPNEAAVQTSAHSSGEGIEDLSNGDDNTADTTVCYGVVSFPGSCKGPSTRLKPMATFPVTIEQDCTFKSLPSEIMYHGRLAVEYVDIVQAILEAQPLELQISCTINPSEALQSKSSHKAQFGDIVQIGRAHV